MPLYILAWSIPSTPYAKHEAVSSNVLTHHPLANIDIFSLFSF